MTEASEIFHDICKMEAEMETLVDRHLEERVDTGLQLQCDAERWLRRPSKKQCKGLKRSAILGSQPVKLLTEAARGYDCAQMFLDDLQRENQGSQI